MVPSRESVTLDIDSKIFDSGVLPRHSLVQTSLQCEIRWAILQLDTSVRRRLGTPGRYWLIILNYQSSPSSYLYRRTAHCLLLLFQPAALGIGLDNLVLKDPLFGHCFALIYTVCLMKRYTDESLHHRLPEGEKIRKY